MSANQLKIAISAGEHSGDEHAARFVEALRQIAPNVTFQGMGGAAQRAVGVETVVDSNSLAGVMGFQEVLYALPRVFAALNGLRKLLSDWQPDLLVVIDYPDFNFRLIRHAHTLGIPVLYFIPPQIWAWRKGRARFLKKHVSAIASIFPFEKKFYQQCGVDTAHYVGHPLAAELDRFRITADERRDFLRTLKLDPSLPLVAIFPGSRKQEIKRHVPVMLEGFEELKRHNPEVQLCIAEAGSVSSELTQQLEMSATKKLALTSDSITLLAAADAALVKSGTSNLQAAFCGTPFAMLYQLPIFTEIVATIALNISEYSIVNVIRPGTIVEFIQRAATPKAIADELRRLLFNQEYRASVKSNLAEVVETLAHFDESALFAGTNSAYERVARLAIETAK